MQSTTKILAGATCALAAAAVLGVWGYGTYTAGRAFDEAAMSNFESVLPDPITARVTRYEGGFFRKNFRVTLEAEGMTQIGTYEGVAKPGLTTTVSLKRVHDSVLDERLMAAGVKGFDDAIELEYSAWDALTQKAEALPTSSLTYTLKPFSIEEIDGKCSFEKLSLSMTTGETIDVSAATPGFICQPVNGPVFKFGAFDLTFKTGSEPIVQAMKGEELGLAATSFTLKMGPLESAAYRHEGLEFSTNLTADNDQKSLWTESLAFTLQKPASAELFFWLPQAGVPDYLKVDMKIRGITPELGKALDAALYSGDVELPLILLSQAMQEKNLVMELTNLALSVNGKEATLKGQVANEIHDGRGEIVGRFAFASPEGVLPADSLAQALAAGWVKKDENGNLTSDLVLSLRGGSANGVPLHY